MNYINETLGINAIVKPILNKDLGNLPMYINQAYNLYDAILFNKNIVLIEQKNEANFSVLQTEKQLQLIRNTFNKTVVLVLENLQSYNRKRLIEKRINFIVADKQLFLPELLINLSENYSAPKAKSKKLMPSSQFILLYYLLNKKNIWQMEAHSFKEIASKLNYTPMAVSYAINELKEHELITIHGEKEKHIKFHLETNALWDKALKQNILESPVLKTMFVDELPSNVKFLKSNCAALPQYANINPSSQPFFAIEKSLFYSLQKNRNLVNANAIEGKYAIEIWKYNPELLFNGTLENNTVVDPLSLYLSLKDSTDERIEMALEQLIEKMIW